MSFEKKGPSSDILKGGLGNDPLNDKTLSDISPLLSRKKMPEISETIESPERAKAIQDAATQVEGKNFSEKTSGKALELAEVIIEMFNDAEVKKILKKSGEIKFGELANLEKNPYDQRRKIGDAVHKILESDDPAVKRYVNRALRSVFATMENITNSLP